MKSYTFIDLFAGAGGLSEGFIRNGFTPIAHVEMNPHASQTIKTRMVYHYLKSQKKMNEYKSYLMGKITREELYDLIPSAENEIIINQEISDETIENIFLEIDKTLLNVTGQNKEVDILVGGPPCQAYSLVGRARDPYGKQNDPRNYLYKQYVRFLTKYKPKMFVFENVPGILSAAKGQLFKDIEEIFDDAGYYIDKETLNAADYGVLQQRKRVIIIGWKKDSEFGYPIFDKIEHSYKVQDLLSDLPKLKSEPGKCQQVGFDYSRKSTAYLSEFHIRNKEDILTQHITRVHNDNDKEIYLKAINLWKNDQKRLRYTDLPENLRTHNNLEVFLDRFKVVGGDLKCSHTMVAHIAKDGHYYIHPDETQVRSLSVREAARIQSFPDDYYFEGPRTAVFTQIGNAVPPLMASKIAKQISKVLNNDSPIKNKEIQQTLDLFS